MGEEAGFLKDHPKCAPVRRYEMALATAGLVLPHLGAEREVTARGSLQSGHRAQAGGLARS